MLDLGDERALGALQLGAQLRHLGRQSRLPAPGPEQAAAEGERGERSGGETTGHQFR